MELYARISILCLLCVARASVVPPEEIAEIRALTHVRDFSKIPKQEPDGLDRQTTENPRDKRALGLLLSGLAQIFGYTITPVQFATLPNPNVTQPATTSNASKMLAKQQAASSRPGNTTVPRQQETIRFTGVLNFGGNNTDILGHLQRYEQLFHGRNNTITASRPSMPPAKISVDPQMRPPLLAPFFVKIPLPIAPDLLPLEPVENLELSNPPPLISMGDSKENTEAPVRKEQEPVYKNNEDTEQYTVKEKDINNEKDVKKPTSKSNHRLYVNEQKRNKQQDDRRNELQRKEEERIKKLKQEEEEEERNRDKDAHYNKEEVDERYRNREEKIADRNRDRASQQQSTEERRPPAHDDEEDEGSAERYKEYVSRENLSDESPKQPPSKKEEVEDYPNYDDDSSEQFNGYKQPVDLDKYVDIVYNRQLPIGDYFHERNPEVIRDSYGEVLDNKKLEDDRIAGYINMFKQPYVQDDAYDSQRGHSPEDASREENEKETSAEDGYDEHLIRLQKLREEYALPENKYEEYDLNEESEEERNDRESERARNRTSVRAKAPARPVTGRGKENGRARRPTESNRNEAVRLENANSQEADYARYMPLIVPIRYIDAKDKMQQATTRQLKYKETDKSTDGVQYKEGKVSPAQTVFNEKLAPQIGLPERPRQLYEGEHKELQVWPPPFDYAYDNTEPVNTIISPNPQNYYSRNYAPNYYQHVKEVAAQDAKDKSTEQPSGYLVVVGNPAYPYRYPYNIYYFSNEAVSSRSQEPHLHAEVTRPRDQVYIAQQSASQQIVQTKPNITEYNLNETTNSPPSQDHYYYQSQVVPASALDRYRYTFGERTPQVKEPFSVDVRSQILNNGLPTVENWSNRIYRTQSPSNTIEEPPRPVYVHLQNIASSNQNAQNEPSERPRYSRLVRRRKSLQSENYRKDDEEAETPQPILKNVQPEDHREDDKEAKTLPQPIQKNLRPEDYRKDDEEAETPQPILRSKTFDDPQSAHDFFGFSKDDYNFESESSEATKVTEENGKTAEESVVLDAPEPPIYHYDDESFVKHTDELENDPEKAKVTEYRNKVATLRVSEQRQLKPNGPIHYVDFTRNI
ncbi:myb-like protein X [Solenopsis invicta]|uniref:myb-like protein X n=1 Tax=Solenopsis invicta TaxID=13686 RepID=UPI00193CEF8C|nr:myb-like protein X [Solenopsis invicta]